MKLSLARLVAVSVGWPGQPIPHFEAQRGDVTVRVLARQDIKQSALFILVAEVLVEPLPLSGEGLLPVPTELRRALEGALDDVANTMAVFFTAHRSISSVLPCVAYVPHDDDARRYLDEASGIDTGDLVQVSEAAVTFDVDPADFRLLEDRRDGAALLAEALATAHAVSQFREYMRFFERAFTLSARALIEPLAAFLAPTPFGFSRDEVGSWVSLRAEAVHADKRPSFALEPDVRHPLRRVRQAAFDVVFNKEVWRDQSSSRRDGVDLRSGIGPDQSLIVRQGSSGAIRSQVFDPFGSYPISFRVRTPVPDGWLVTTPPYDASTVGLKVLPETDA